MTAKRRYTESAQLFAASTSNAIGSTSLESALLRSTSDKSSDAFGEYQRTAAQCAGKAEAGSRGAAGNGSSNDGGRRAVRGVLYWHRLP